MTDKEIIIDGIDVAGCAYMLNNKIKGKQHCPAKSMPYAKETSCICRKSIDTPYNFCKHNPNCYYKQLKRLEQENARLKEKIESMLCSANCYAYKKADTYRQTLSKIKEIANTRFVNGLNEEADIYNAEMDRILDLITKAESEG